MGVAPGGVHQKGSFVVADGLCKSLGALLYQNVPPSSLARRGDVYELALGIVQVWEDDIALEFWLSNLALDAATVDGDIAEIGQKLLGAVLGLHQGEEGRPTERRKMSDSQFSTLHRLSGTYVSSIKVVQQLPAMKVSWVSKEAKKGMLVLTPRILNSTRARRIFRRAISYVEPLQVHLTNMES